LTSLLAAIHVSPLVQQESDLEKKTQDTCGLTSGDTLNQLDLFGASLKTSKDTSALDSEESSATWKLLVIEQRGEYSQRVKLALLTREKESTSWATPRAADSAGGPRTLNGKGQRISVSDPTKTYGANLSDQVRHWPTPTTGEEKYRLKGDSQASKCLEAKARKGELATVSGKLNPDWVEWLMGVPTGWTGLGSWGTE